MTRRLRALASRPAAVCGIPLLLASIAGCSSPPPLPINTGAAWATRTLDHGQVRLSVPSDWNVGEAWQQASSFSDLLGSFSNQLLSSPCTEGPASISCGPPLQDLQPGAILVEIWENGAPNWSLDTQPGTATTVSGFPARLTDESGSTGSCSGLGADRSRSESIPFPSAPDNWIEIAICSRSVADAVGARIMASVAVTLPE
jgi:hypothetical protein